MKLFFLIWILPAMFLFSCNDEEVTKKGPRLDYYLESYDVADLGFTPQLKIKYLYNKAGQLIRYSVLSYNPNTENMELQRYFLFSYTDNKVNSIKGYLQDASNSYVDYSYQYLPNDAVSKIIETYSAGTSSEASFSYAEDGTVKVSYVFSNGESFEYEFTYAGENVISDKTTDGSQLCNYGVYTYDNNNNPFNSLGYVDYLLNNLSINNKLTENVNYVGCSFPSLIPESYVYEYNDSGYPITATTFYKSEDGEKKSKKDFFYSSN